MQYSMYSIIDFNLKHVANFFNRFKQKRIHVIEKLVLTQFYGNHGFLFFQMLIILSVTCPWYSNNDHLPNFVLHAFQMRTPAIFVIRCTSFLYILSMNCNTALQHFLLSLSDKSPEQWLSIPLYFLSEICLYLDWYCIYYPNHTHTDARGIDFL